MENKEFILDELFSINTKLNELVDEMIKKYGHFLSLEEAKKDDNYAQNLAYSYSKLAEEKDYLVEQLNVCDR